MRGTTSGHFDVQEFFSDEGLITDPYRYYADHRSRCPVSFDPEQGVMTVTGYDEALAVYRDAESFSACNAVIGPLAGVPFEPVGDDIGEQIAQHRAAMPMSEFLPTLDPPAHGRVRGLLNRLMTPRRLAENEAFMWSLAESQLDEFIGSGSGDFVRHFAQPLSLLVIADLLGVPAEDHGAFRRHLAEQASAGSESQAVGHNPLAFYEERFTEYVEDRRRSPREDVLTELARATYPDGTTPEVVDVVRLATFLFAAGQETSAKMLTFAVQVLAERPELQERLRGDRDLIPGFLEETLRIESPLKAHFRLTRKTTTIGTVAVPAGTTVMLLPGAANRDPGHFEDPAEFRADRRNVREHLAFGRGIHTCPGAPLSRVEGRVSLERILSRLEDITISDAHHGPAGARRYSYEPMFIMRGLRSLHIEFTPA